VHVSRVKVYWLCQILGWSIYQTVGLAFIAAYMTVDRRAVIATFGSIVSAVCASHIHRLTIRRFKWLQLDWLKRVPRLLISTVLTGTMAAIGAAIIGVYIAGYGEIGPQFIAMIMTWIVAMLFWTILYAAIHDVENYKRAERDNLALQLAAREAELGSLLAQVNPHFLFNWLNNLRGMISEDPQRAQDIVTRFADLMRYSLQSHRRREVKLGEELEAVENYLECEKMRFEERLTVEWDVSPEARDILLPPMIIQTLVENGVKHGIAQLPQGGTIRISADVRAGELCVEVISSGAWVEANANGTRTGIANATARLELLYGSSSRLTFDKNQTGSVAARLSIPCNQGVSV
jgi:sensor histidine kinase YesM